jgi:hypothetical protein
MTPDDLEAQSNSDLIALIQKQQTQIAELQAQLAQIHRAARKNGEAFDDALQAVDQVAPAGRFPATLRLILIVAGLLTCVVVLIIANFKAGALLSVGFAPDYEPGSVTALQLPDPDQANSIIPILLVNVSSGGWLALHSRDPGSGCLVNWEASTQRIEDPCGGSKYTRTGEYVSGPSPRGLDRFAVEVKENGEVLVDVSALRVGPARP